MDRECQQEKRKRKKESMREREKGRKEINKETMSFVGKAISEGESRSLGAYTPTSGQSPETFHFSTLDRDAWVFTLYYPGLCH